MHLVAKRPSDANRGSRKVGLLLLYLGLLTPIAAASCHAGGLQGRLFDGGTPGNGGAAGNDTGGNGGASAGGMGGASGLAGGGGTAGASAAALDISGRWALFGFEDPVAVELQQTGTVLAGKGCCTGFQSNIPLACCGPVTGQCADRRASFGFSFDLGGTYEYATDAFVSADGSRMAGTFSRIDTPVAWIRLAAGPRAARFQPAPRLRKSASLRRLTWERDIGFEPTTFSLGKRKRPFRAVTGSAK